MEDVQFVTNDEIPLQCVEDDNTYLYLILTGEVSIYLSKSNQKHNKNKSKSSRIKHMDY